MITKRTVKENGGVEMAIMLNAEEAAYLKGEEEQLVEQLAEVLSALHVLRHPEMERQWESTLRETSSLIEQMEGVRDAALRLSPASKFSDGELARMLNRPRSTVQYRREAGKLPPAEQSVAEVWARTGDRTGLLLRVGISGRGKDGPR